ncbi:glutamyl-tRNA(Gln) amidotransferase subunit B, mitochondrial-like [Corticium candelabrum]|uniref:glutamyl-tRNA(Gln) amidotransferase subunit B, mitochondrial-like n=1 Tax=Corticium candelabrum TaxID=121492 RepID=UPI002E25D1C5|nr:glutamyl-tRNA(Gln) amidotransferase subunit B, mitochondrial-like [Corticium candelabrum]
MSDSCSVCVASFVSSGSKWKALVGLEIHAQIKSDVKLFSRAPTEFDRPPNSSVQLFDAAFPGSLPVLNYFCVEAALRTALALDCRINEVSYFDRKHYFYSDLPAGYQITQHRVPLAVGGHVTFSHEDTAEVQTVRIKQLHLEQDSGRSIVDEEGRVIFVDLNRCGIGLMEIVTQPDMTSGDEVATAVRELRQVLLALDTCDGDMATASLRVDANISLHGPGSTGIRTEIKNVSGISNLRKAVDQEIARHIKLLEKGRDVVSETRSFDVKQGITVPARHKHFQKQDYRFMPDPDLPPLNCSAYKSLDIPTLLSTLPALPGHTRRRLMRQYSIAARESTHLVNQGAVQYFETAAQHCEDARKLAVWVTKNLAGILNTKRVSIDASPISPLQLSSIINLLAKESISVRTAQNIFYCMVDGDQRLATEITEENRWYQITSRDALMELCQTVIGQNEEQLKQYHSGKKELFQFFFGQVQRRCGGCAHPGTLHSVLSVKLDSENDTDTIGGSD